MRKKKQNRIDEWKFGVFLKNKELAESFFIFIISAARPRQSLNFNISRFVIHRISGLLISKRNFATGLGVLPNQVSEIMKQLLPNKEGIISPLGNENKSLGEICLEKRQNISLVRSLACHSKILTFT